VTCGWKFIFGYPKPGAGVGRLGCPGLVRSAGETREWLAEFSIIKPQSHNASGPVNISRIQRG